MTNHLFDRLKDVVSVLLAAPRIHAHTHSPGVPHLLEGIDQLALLRRSEVGILVGVLALEFEEVGRVTVFRVFGSMGTSTLT